MKEYFKVWNVLEWKKEHSMYRQVGAMVSHEEGMFLEIFTHEKTFSTRHKGKCESNEAYTQYEIYARSRLFHEDVEVGLVLLDEASDKGKICLVGYPEDLHFFRRRE